MFSGFSQLIGLNTAYAQTKSLAQHQPSGTEQLLSILPTLVLFAAAIYFVMIRPQMKKERSLKTLINAIKIGDEVLFHNGFVGIIKKITRNYYLLALNQGVLVTIAKKNAKALVPKGTLKATLSDKSDAK